MKKVLYLFVALLTLQLASCSKVVDPTDAGDASLSSARLAANGPGRKGLTIVDVATLPALVASYVSTTYPGATIKHAATDAAGDLVVLVRLADGSRKALVFDAKGAFKQELQPRPKDGKGGRLCKMDAVSLPSSVTDYITKSYAGAVVDFAVSDKAGDFLVLITQNGVKKGLIFDAAGNFKKELEKRK